MSLLLSHASRGSLPNAVPCRGEEIIQEGLTIAATLPREARREPGGAWRPPRAASILSREEAAVPRTAFSCNEDSLETISEAPTGSLADLPEDVRLLAGYG